MRTALLTAIALVALSSLAVAQNQLAATTPTAPEAKPVNPDAVVDPAVPKARAIDWNATGDGRLHWMIDKPCRGSEGIYSVGACQPGPPPYKPRP